MKKLCLIFLCFVQCVYADNFKTPGFIKLPSLENFTNLEAGFKYLEDSGEDELYSYLRVEGHIIDENDYPGGLIFPSQGNFVPIKIELREDGKKFISVGLVESEDQVTRGYNDYIDNARVLTFSYNDLNSGIEQEKLSLISVDLKGAFNKINMKDGKSWIGMVGGAEVAKEKFTFNPEDAKTESKARHMTGNIGLGYGLRLNKQMNLSGEVKWVKTLLSRKGDIMKDYYQTNNRFSVQFGYKAYDTYRHVFDIFHQSKFINEYSINDIDLEDFTPDHEVGARIRF